MVEQKVEFDQSKILESLENLGLDSFESKVYLFISSHQPMTASAISYELAIDRTKAYRVVESLSQKGLITQTLENPRRCIMVDPEESIGSLIDEWKEKYDVGSKNKSKIVDFIKKKTIEPGLQFDSLHFTVLNNRNACYSSIKTKIKRSNLRILICTDYIDLTRMYYTQIPEFLDVAIKKGRQCTIITDSNHEDLDKKYKKCNFVVTKKKITGRIVVFENHSLIMSSKLNSENDISVSIREPQIIQNLMDYLLLITKQK